MNRTVRCGLDRFLGPLGRPWKKRRLGLIVHGASVTNRLEHAVDALRRTGFRITAIFAPEHGLNADLQDQCPVPGAKDPKTALPLFSLYGKTLSPTPSALAKVDAVIFDLQDIGVRYYTFIWTMALAMKACAEAGKPVIVLDRPNPLGGEKMEGNLPDPAFASFVGLLPLPVLHGMTTAELARHFNRTQHWRADLHVVPMTGWRRSMRFNETGLPWVLPSPNMPTLDTATVYGGMCLLEATNLSEGRGTTRPFEIVGAPFIESGTLAHRLTSQKIPGVQFRPLHFRPTFNKWAGQLCGGVQLHVTDPARFQSFRTGLSLIQTVRQLSPKFQWKNPPYEYETKKKPMDILCGTDQIRHSIETGKEVSARSNSEVQVIGADQRQCRLVFDALRER
ncbi:MAG: DUF1343 domain-containing protein [Elusimicrobia bacterium]|nr:DUF1343 domain-containing protein [Elusimicrobiota bacterium]